jgi:hypothetical protein
MNNDLKEAMGKSSGPLMLLGIFAIVVYLIFNISGINIRFLLDLGGFGVILGMIFEIFYKFNK